MTSEPQKQTQQPFQQSLSASQGGTIQDVVQAIVNGVEGDFVLYKFVSTRSDREELNDYVRTGIKEFEARLYKALLAPSPVQKPYKFLYPFDLEDASNFFGRRQATEELLAKVRDNRIMIVHARSGAGKSSLLNAGLSPLLIRDGRLPLYVRSHQAKDPVEGIKHSMLPPSDGVSPPLLEALTLHQFLRLAMFHLSPGTKELVVILDQFELFLASLKEKDPQARQLFIQSLQECYEDPGLRVRFVLSLRYENVWDLEEFETYIPHLLNNRYQVPPMSEAELREAITRPIKDLGTGISIEPKLLDELVLQLGGQDVELTHLQIVCSELYNSLEPGQQLITYDLYQRLGKIDRLLKIYLERTLEPLPDYNRKVARIVLKELVSSEATNRILSFDELIKAIPPDEKVLDLVLQHLVEYRLLRRGALWDAKEYELAHAYLAREIYHWIDSDELETRRAQELLQRELATWRQYGIIVYWEKLDRLKRRIEYLPLGREARIMLFDSALEQGHDVVFWLTQTEDQHEAASQAASQLLVNKAARSKIISSVRPGLTKELQTDFLLPLWANFSRSKFWKKMEPARLLWRFRSWMSWKEKSRVLPVLLPVWAVSYGFPGLVTVLLAGFLYNGIVSYSNTEQAADMNWVLIPDRGEFLMGMDDHEAENAHRDCLDAPDTLPGVCDTDFEKGFLMATSGRLKNARLSPYEILENEVTIHQYGLCIDQGPCQEPTNWEKQQLAINDPVRNITWYQASAYCAWLGGHLPTEGEWEKAARGPQNFIYSWGPSWDPNKANLEHGKTGGVRSVLDFAASDVSGYDVLNLAGNVREWTASQYRDNGTDQDFNNTELTQSVIDSDTSGTQILAVVRGGSWQTLRSEGMSPRRGREALDQTRDTVGFRCVCPVAGTCSLPGGSWWDQLLRQ